MPLNFNTIQQWHDYGSVRNKRVPLDPLTPTNDETAGYLLGNDYVRTHFFNLFKPEFKGDSATLTSIPAEPRARLEEAANIACSIELENPGTFATIINPARARSLKKSGEEEWFEGTPATTSQITENLTIQTAIHDLLDQYLLVPIKQTNTNNNNTNTGECTGLPTIISRDLACM